MEDIQLVRRETLPRAAATLTRAFMDDPVYVWIYPDPGQRSRGLRWLWATALEFGRRYAHATQTDAGLAAAIWFPPDTATTPARMVRVGFLAAPFRMGLGPFASFMRLNNLMDDVHHRLMPGPHWYLSIVGVDPEVQGRGRRTALVVEGLAHADAAGLPCYLETSNERNLPFYERHGFAVSETAAIGEQGPTGWAMRREPRRR